MSVIFQRVCLIGIGLIGASMALAMRRGGLAGKIVGHARSDETRKKALALGLVDEVYATPEAAVRDADLVVLCVPVGICGALTRKIASDLAPGAILTDVGSVKAAIVADMQPHVPSGVHFVPAHPIAGSEKSGPEAGFAELFDNRWCILTPLPDGDPEATKKLSKLWQAIGSRVETMTPGHHDLVLAITSHLPHLIAFNMVNTAQDLANVTDSDVIKFSAGGFRDFTRIAASDPTMWRDVFLNNKEATLEMLGRFSEDLTELQKAIRRSDGDTLFSKFSAAREIRRGIIDAGQDTPEPDFGRHSGGSGRSS